MCAFEMPLRLCTRGPSERGRPAGISKLYATIDLFLAFGPTAQHPVGLSERENDDRVDETCRGGVERTQRSGIARRRGGTFNR